MLPEQNRVIDHHTGDYVPYSFLVCVASLTSHGQYVWDGTSGLSSLPEKTRKSNHLQMSLQRKEFILSYLKTLSVGPAGAWTHDLPHGSQALYQMRVMYQWRVFVPTFMCFFRGSLTSCAIARVHMFHLLWSYLHFYCVVFRNTELLHVL